MGSAFVLEGHVNGLGLARALGEKGIEVYLLDKNKYNLARYSKHCKRFLKIPDEIKNPEDYIYHLESLKKKNNLNEPVIFPTHDDQVYILSKYKRRLEENFKVSVPEWCVTKKCYKKYIPIKLQKSLESRYLDRISEKTEWI